MSRPIAAAAQYVEPAVAVSSLDIAVAASVRYVDSQQDVRVRASVSIQGAAQVASVSVLHADIDAGELDAGAQSASARANVIAHEAHAIALGGAARDAVAHAAQVAIVGHRASAARSAALAMAAVVSHAANAAAAFSNDIAYDFFLRFVERLHDETDGVFDSISDVLFEKGLVEIVSQSDALNFAFSKALADTTTPTDALAVSVTKVLADSATPSEASTRSVGKVLADSQPAADGTPAFVVSKVLADSATPSEAKAVDFQRGTELDSVTPADSTAFSFGFSKFVSGWTSAVLNGGFWSLMDSSFTLNDSPLHGGDMGDEVLSSDFVFISVDPVKADSVVATDAITTFSTSLGKSDSVAPIEAASVDFTRGTESDSVTASDSITSIGFNYSKAITGWTSAVLNGGFYSLIDFPFTLNDAPLHGGDMGDEVLASDFLFVDLSKALSDSSSPSDVATVDTSLSKTDSVAPVDAPAVSFTRGTTADTVTPSDASTLDVGKAASDSASPSDSSPVFDFGKNPSDSATPAEAMAFDVSKPLADAATPADSFSFIKEIAPVFITGWNSAVLHGGFWSLGFSSFTLNDAPLGGGELGDEVMSSDYVVSLDTSLAKTEAVAASDASAMDVGLAKSESVTPADAVSTSFSKALSDSASATDSIAIDFQQASSDSVAPDDSGFSTSMEPPHMLNESQLDAAQLN